MRASLTSLSPAERTLAEQNLYLIPRFLRANRLSADEWYDVVIFRYLLTVQKWFRQPELYRYAFSTIAWKAMQSAVGNERKKLTGVSRPSAWRPPSPAPTASPGPTPSPKRTASNKGASSP